MAAVPQRFGLAAVGALDWLALLITWPQPSVLVGHLAAPHRWVQEVGTDGGALELAILGLWFTAVWLAVGLLGALAAAVPGNGGTIGAALARFALPKALQTLAAGALGVSIMITPMLAQAVPGPTTAGRTGSTPEVLSIQMPLSQPMAQPARIAIVGWPSNPVRDNRFDVPWPHLPTSTASTTGVITVSAGDSLWLIAARRLAGNPADAEIAAAWPRWYEANAITIGADPNLITAGQQLHVPSKGPIP
jgi:hypothetical protein